MKKHNILFITATLRVGGLETYLVNLIRTLPYDLFGSTVIYNESSEQDFISVLQEAGAEVLQVSNSYWQVDFIYKLSGIIKNRNIDIICDFRDDFSAPSMLAAKMCGVKSRVAMYRSSRPCFRPTPIKNAYASVLHQIVKSTATRIIGNSSKVLDSFYPTWKNCNKYAVVHNGIPLDTFTQKYNKANVRIELGIPTDAFVIGHVGRLHESKNHMVILDCFAKIRNDCANAYLLLVGDGSLRKRIEFDLAKMGISNRVVMAGQRRDIAQMLSAMDIFLYPSIYEGMPTAFVEAMAAGLPFIASNITEIREITPSSLLCNLFKPDDSKGMAAAILNLMRDTHQMSDIGETAQIWAIENFGIEKSAEKLCRHFLEPLE